MKDNSLAIVGIAFLLFANLLGKGLIPNNNWSSFTSNNILRSTFRRWRCKDKKDRKHERYLGQRIDGKEKKQEQSVDK